MAVEIDRAGGFASVCATGERDARRGAAVHAGAGAVADVGRGLHVHRARRGIALDAGGIQLTSACAVTEAVEVAGGGSIVVAVVVEIESDNDGTAHAIDALALRHRGARFATIAARDVATNAVDTIAAETIGTKAATLTIVEFARIATAASTVRAFIAGVGVYSNGTADAIDSRALERRSAGIAGSSACVIATDAVGAEAARAFIWRGTRGAIGLRGNAQVGDANVTHGAIGIRDAGRLARRRSADEGRAGRRGGHDAYAQTIAQALACLDRARARLRSANGRCIMKGARSTGRAHASCSARRLALHGAVVVGVGACNNRRAKPIGLASQNIRASAAGSGACGVAAEVIDAESGETTHSTDDAAILTIGQLASAHAVARFVRTRARTDVVLICRHVGASAQRSGQTARFTFVGASRVATNAVGAEVARALVCPGTDLPIRLLGHADHRPAIMRRYAIGIGSAGRLAGRGATYVRRAIRGAAIDTRAHAIAVVCIRLCGARARLRDAGRAGCKELTGGASAANAGGAAGRSGQRRAFIIGIGCHSYGSARTVGPAGLGIRTGLASQIAGRVATDPVGAEVA